MSDNGMGGRRIGKKYHQDGKNIEEGTDYEYYADSALMYPDDNIRMFQHLLVSRKRTKKKIRWAKRHWLEPKPQKLRLVRKEIK